MKKDTESLGILPLLHTLSCFHPSNFPFLRGLLLEEGCFIKGWHLIESLSLPGSWFPEVNRMKTKKTLHFGHFACLCLVVILFLIQSHYDTSILSKPEPSERAFTDM